VQVVKVLITQDETTLILDYKLGRSIMLVLLIFATETQVKWEIKILLLESLVAEQAKKLDKLFYNRVKEGIHN
jgi:hypothetical protein